MESALDFSLVRRFTVKRVANLQPERIVDTVAREEPLAIHVSHWTKDARHTDNLAVTMRTPGADRELAAGLLLSEGVIRHRRDLEALRPLGIEPSDEIMAELAKGVDFEAWRQARNGFVSSSCGVCGKASREQIALAIPPLAADGLRVRAELIQSLPELLLQGQRAFAQTGGVHAAAIVTTAGVVHSVFEDIGRHNALDKLIGNALLEDRLPLSDHVVFLSSRSSFELIQKAAMSGAPILATVGGPSSLAIETARQTGITLLGFVREGRFTIYSGDWRIDL
jgi:FdhD protein